MPAKGSKVYLECCGKTGIENHPIFHRDAVDRNGDRQWIGGGHRTVYNPGEHAGGTEKLARPTNREQREEQDRLYLALLTSDAGWTTKIIAKKFDVKPAEVKAGIARARQVALAVSA